MKIKLDENLSRHLKDELLGLGHDVSTALEEGLLGKDDVELGAAAKTDGLWCLLWISTLQTFESFRRDRILESFCSDLAAWDRWLLTNLY